MIYKPIHYHDYLKLDQILNSQSMRSEDEGSPAHEEMLFIIVHQAYELWFKQLLYELDSIMLLFNQPKLEESSTGLIVSRLERFIKIQKLIEGQIDVLETMSPLEFLDFRDMLYPASGFQSFQFRLLENKLGLKNEMRLTYNNSPYYKSFAKEQAEELLKAEESPSLFTNVEKWLERTPFLNLKGFHFWEVYRQAVIDMFKTERELINRNQELDEESRQRALNNTQKSEDTFLTFFSEEDYNQLKDQGQWRLSYKALHAVLFIQLYRQQPALTLPFRIIDSLMQIDELMTQWRYRHALMAKRMLGEKVGTGGSSGSQYLKQSAEKHKLFTDFFQLTTFLIPRSKLPSLPIEVKKQMNFYYQE